MNHEQFKIMNMKEEEILEKAIQKFKDITGGEIEILDNRLNKNVKANGDAIIKLVAGNQEVTFWVEVKNEIREQNLPRFLYFIKNNPTEWLLVCQYIPKPLKENLKNQGINYLETAGNCFIRKDGLFFYINDKAVTTQRQPKEGKLWKQAGLKFLFGILENPQLLNAPYRTMAEIATVALGNIGPFIQELKDEGFVKEGMKNGKPLMVFENKEMLRNKWIELFNAVLKPKLKQGRFRFINKADLENWKEAPATFPRKFYWGGEPAAALLTEYLQPEVFTIYTKMPKIEIMKQLRLVPDKNGNVEIMDIFWNPQMFDFLNKNTNTVPPLLAYAELITSLDSRNRETAERIKQKYLG